MEQRTLYVGYDLCEDYSGISCFNSRTLEPESICVGKDHTKQFIPTVVGVSWQGKDWLYGEEALEIKNNGNGIVVDGLLTKIIEKKDITIMGSTISPIIVLSYFLKKTLRLIKQYYPNNSIKMLVVTLQEMNPILIEGVYLALQELGMEKDRVLVQSHTKSYQYYVLSQGKELWMNDIGLFDFDMQGLKYHQMSIERRISPNVVGISSKDFSETLNYNMLDVNTEEERLQYIFRNIAKNLLHNQVISTIYVTGRGFEGTWADKILLELCSGRRIFKGSNLYTRGACYAAKEIVEYGKLQDFIFLSDEMIQKTITIDGYYNGKQSDIILVKPTTPWYEVNERLDVILDEEDTVTFTIIDAMSSEKVVEKIKLDKLRQNKTTRIELRVQCFNKDRVVLSVKDKGFGEFFPSSNRIWEREVTL